MRINYIYIYIYIYIYPPLMNHTRAPKTEAMFMLPVWPDPPDDEESAHRGQIFECICKEWEVQVTTIKEAAAAEAEEEAKLKMLQLTRMMTN